MLHKWYQLQITTHIKMLQHFVQQQSGCLHGFLHKLEVLLGASQC